MGPVVQNLAKLKFVKISILKYGKYIDIFAENVSSFAMHFKSYSHFCNKISMYVFENTLDTTINEFVINELVKLTML